MLLNLREQFYVGLERFAEVSTHPTYGVSLKLRDVEIANQFEDFMTQNCFVHFVVKNNDEGSVSFLFCEVAAESKVHELYLKFSQSAVAH